MPIWLQVLGVCLVFVTFIGSAVVFLRGSADAGTIKTLEKNNTALTDRVGILEKENAEMKARLALLERENIDLRGQRPSAEVLVEIRSGLTSYHDELTDYIDKQRGSNAETHALLMAIATTLGERNDP